MAKRVGVDKWIFFTTLLLVVVGLVMVFSASAVTAQARFNSPYAFVGRQAAWALAGICAMLVLSRVDYTRYNSPRFIFPALAITTMLLVLVFFFRDSHNTHRWIRFGSLFTFQPSEIAKPVIILFLAWFLSTRLDQINDWRNTLLKAAIMPVVYILLIVKQPDLGTSLVVAGVSAMVGQAAYVHDVVPAAGRSIRCRSRGALGTRRAGDLRDHNRRCECVAGVSGRRGAVHGTSLRR